MADQITLRDVYDEQRETRKELASLGAGLAAYQARVDERLDNGSRRMEELAGANTDLSGRVTALERAQWKTVGAASVLSVLAGGIASTVLAHLH